jgi:ABC-type antimicrobial peptide transport system permease subunit
LGIRIALGANGRSVGKLVIKQGALLGLAGISIGAPAAIGFNLLVRQHLAGITGSDPIGFTTIALLLMLVILAASWIPARRAMRIDPMQALRLN